MSSWLPRSWGFGGGRAGPTSDSASQPNQYHTQPQSNPPAQTTVDPRQLYQAQSSQQHIPQNIPGYGIQPAMPSSPSSHVLPGAPHHLAELPMSPPQHSGMVQGQFQMSPPAQPYSPHSSAQQPDMYSPYSRAPAMQLRQPSFASSSPDQHYYIPQNMKQHTQHQNQNLTVPGPKQSRKPTTSSNEISDSSKPAIPRYDPKQLLGGRGAAAKAAEKGHDDLTAEHPAEAEDSALGQSSMLARQYGLTNREATSQHKKRKSEVQDEEDAPDRKKPKAVFDGKISGGDLGHYMKKEREKYAAERGPSTTVDLTADDDEGGDDDLVVIGSNKIQRKAWENEVICLGALKVKANISKLPMMSKGSFKDYWPQTKVFLNRTDPGAMNTKVEVLDKHKNSCGMLEHKTARVIAKLLDAKANGLINVEFKPWTLHRKREDGEYPGQNTSRSLELGIEILSSRSKAAMIGKMLGQEQVFLQPPNHVGIPASNKEFINPQLPKNYGPGAAAPRQLQTSRTTTYSMRTVEEVQQQCMSMFDNLTKHEDLPRMEPKSGLVKTDLLDHQKQALYFLTDHESEDNSGGEGQTFSLWKPKDDQKGVPKWGHVITGEELRSKPDPIRGGILADMMGLGKTLSILSLIAETKENAKTFYQEGEREPGKKNAVGTLIVCPKSVLSNWEEQLKTHIKPDKLRCYTYHGSSRITDAAELAKFNIVLTTYNTAAAEFASKGKPLAALRWFRIVLDEAHSIRTQNTQVFKAAIDLSAERRWAVTGTPVQNKLEDLQALIRFLRIKPFDEAQVWGFYIGTPLKNGNSQAYDHLRLLVDSITLRRGKDKIGLVRKHESNVRLDFSDGDRNIYADMSAKQNTRLRQLTGGFTRRFKGKAYAHVLKAIGMLRAFCAHGLDMLSEEDVKEVLHGLTSDSAIAIDLEDEPDLVDFNNFVTDRSAFDYLQNEIDTDGNGCVICAKKVGAQKGDVDAEEGEESSDDEDDHVMGYLTPCYHLLCPGCKPRYEEAAMQSMTADRRCNCPQCEAYIVYGLYSYWSSKYDDYLDAKANKGKKEKRIWTKENYKGPSAKVQALLQELDESKKETASLPKGEPPIRSVVFSGWTAYLDLIEVALDDHDVGYVRLDGSMSVKQRSTVLRQFATDPTITVILVSIKAGGQGLNFTAANKVYMMEPQYNPGVEHQAIDRVHRLGQQREVFIKHYIMKDSVEEGILRLQKKKTEMAQRTLERGKKGGGKGGDEQRMEDLKALFGTGKLGE